MTAIAGVGDAHFYGQIRAGNAETVIMARVHHHIGGGRCVTGHAIHALGADRVEMVLRRLVFCRQVALQTDLAARRTQLATVRFVAVAATHPFHLHFALQERTVIEHFVLHLAVGVVEVRRQQRQTVSVQQRLAKNVILPKLPAPRVATGTHLQFAVRRTQCAHWGAGCGRLLGCP